MLIPEESDQEELSAAIFDSEYGIKATGNAPSARACPAIATVASRLKERAGAQQLLLGCTEFSLADRRQHAGGTWPCPICRTKEDPGLDDLLNRFGAPSTAASSARTGLRPATSSGSHRNRGLLTGKCDRRPQNSWIGDISRSPFLRQECGTSKSVSSCK